jgi:hypothetical protein
MEGEWLTYREAAERLGSTAEAIRYRAMRGKWPRRRGNDGRARIQPPDDARTGRTPSEPRAPRADAALVDALNEHIGTLKTQLALTEAQLAEANARADAAIAALGALADRLNAMAIDRARPWWKRIGGTSTQQPSMMGTATAAGGLRRRRIPTPRSDGSLGAGAPRSFPSKAILLPLQASSLETEKFT